MLNNSKKYKDYMILISDSFISRDFIVESEKEGLAVLFLLMRNITLANRVDTDGNKWHEVIFNMKMIYDELNIQANRRSQKDKVIRAIDNMIDYGVFQGDVEIGELNVNELVRLETTLIEDDFTMVSHKEFIKIFRYSEQRVDNFGLFNTYLAIKRYANTNTGVCYPSIEHLRYICNIKSNGTMSKYINILEDLGLINCKRGQKYVDIEKQRVRNSHNIYTVLEIVDRKLSTE